MAQESIRGQDTPPEGPQAEPAARAETGPGRPTPGERRSRDRVADDQKSGQGAMSALSRLQMIERRRAALEPDGSGPA
jgi:hypothetical protein